MATYGSKYEDILVTAKRAWTQYDNPYWQNPNVFRPDQYYPIEKIGSQQITEYVKAQNPLEPHPQEVEQQKPKPKPIEETKTTAKDLSDYGKVSGRILLGVGVVYEVTKAVAGTQEGKKVIENIITYATSTIQNQDNLDEEPWFEPITKPVKVQNATIRMYGGLFGRASPAKKTKKKPMTWEQSQMWKLESRQLDIEIALAKTQAKLKPEPWKRPNPRWFPYSDPWLAPRARPQRDPQQQPVQPSPYRYSPPQELPSRRPRIDPEYEPKPVPPAFIPLPEELPVPPPTPFEKINTPVTPRPEDPPVEQPQSKPIPDNIPNRPPNVGQNFAGSISLQVGTRSKPTLRVRIRRTRYRQKEENTRRKDQKTDAAGQYRAMLHLVNRTWGTVSEVIEFYEALRDNISVFDDRKGRWYSLGQLTVQAQAEALLRVASGTQEYKVNWAGLVKDLAINHAMDKAIGQVSKKYAEALQEMGITSGIRGNPNPKL